MFETECKRKIILTGATGSIGLAIIRLCKKWNWDVCAIVNPGSVRNCRIISDKNVCKIECDLSEIRKLSNFKECRGAKYFLHLGWSGTVGEARNDVKRQQQNIQYALDSCMVAHEIGCEVFLFAGSQAEYGRVEGQLNGTVSTKPENPYGVAKLEAGLKTKELCEQVNIRHLYFRILSVYGPGDSDNSMIMSTINKLKSGIKPKFTKGEQLWDFLYCDDAAKALLFACEKGRSDRIYCLGSGIARPLREYINIIGLMVNPKIPLGIGELPYRENQVMYLCADISDLTGDTGFMPKVSFEEGIRRVMEANEE